MAALAEEYIMLVMFLVILLGIPPLRWIYRTYVTLFIKAAQDQVGQEYTLSGYQI